MPPSTTTYPMDPAAQAIAEATAAREEGTRQNEGLGALGESIGSASLLNPLPLPVLPPVDLPSHAADRRSLAPSSSPLPSPPATMSAAASVPFASFELHHCSSKGRYLVASNVIEAGATLWQELPVIVCSSMDAAAAPAVQMDSPEERAFAVLLPSLPSQLYAHDVLLTLHAMRRLRLFGRRSRVWSLLEQLQSKPDEAAASSSSDASSTPSRFQQRFKVLSAAAQQIFDALQQQLASTSSLSSAPVVAAAAAASDSNAVVVDARTIEQFIGILQLNSHRTAKLPSQESSAASDFAVASPSASPSRSGKALSLRLSMLEHDCAPNLDFTSEWVDASALPPALTPAQSAADAAVAETDAALVSVGVHGSDVLFASSARFPLPAASSTLVLSLRALRAIPEGQSLSISYYPCRVRTAVRQAHLRGLYGFECRCNVCTGRDESRAFWCCFDDDAEKADASSAGADGQSASSSLPIGRRCPGLLSPVGLGQRFSDFSCALCGRSLTTEAQYQRLLEVEQAMRRGGEAVSSPSSFKFLRPHPTHYLNAIKRKSDDTTAATAHPQSNAAGAVCD